MVKVVSLLLLLLLILAISSTQSRYISAQSSLAIRLGQNGVLEGLDTSSGTYLPICTDYFTPDSAQAVCGILGFSRSSATFSQGPTSTTTLPVSDFDCPSTATSTDQCYYGTSVGCQGEHTVIVDCSRAEAPFSFAIQNSTGLVMATRTDTSTTGTLCNDGFSQAAAIEICRLSGVANPTGVQWWTQSTYASYPVVLESVSCPSGTTDFKTQCNYSLTTDCTNLEAVAINCGSTPLAVDFTIGTNGVLYAAATGSVTPSYVEAGSFDIGTAKAVCRMMGFTNLDAATFNTTTVTTRFSFFSALACPESATSIGGCTYTLGREQNADYSATIVGLNCGSARQAYSLRQYQNSLVQVQRPGSDDWGTMCDDGIDYATVRGICSILGQSSASVAWWNIRGSGSILLDDVVCPDSAMMVTGCSYQTVSDCTHDEDLAIACDTTAPNLFAFSLAGSGSSLMVKTPDIASATRTVCADTMDLATATALCRFAGQPTASVSWTTTAVTDVTTVGLRSVSCNSMAGNIFDCTFSQAGACSVSMDLVCSSDTTAAPSTVAPTPVPSGATTFPAASPTLGLELRVNGATGMLEGYDTATSTWESVCSDFFDADTAVGVCNILGLPSSGASFYVSGAGMGSLGLSDLMCPTTATSLADCSYGTYAACTGGEAAVYLTCEASTTSFTFSIGQNGLLLATDTTSSVQGTVCNDGFSQSTAVEICKLSGVANPTGVQWWTLSTYSNLPVLLESINCPSGATSQFSDCSFSQTHDCTNLEAIAINCGSNPLAVDFTVDSSTGILSAAASGSVVPGYVVSTGFDSATAQKVCSWMGYTDMGSVSFATTSVTTRFAFFNQLTCGSSASTLSDCATVTLGHELASDTTLTVVTLSCGGTRASYTVTQGANMIVQVTSPGGGSVGTMCDDEMTTTTAQALCTMMGKSSSNVGFWNARGSGSILLDDVICPGTATDLSECQYATTSDCTHDEDLAIACDTSASGLFQFSIDSSSNNAVLVAAPGYTSSVPVCADHIDQATAEAICNMVGMPGAVPTTGATTVTAGSLPAGTIRSLMCASGATNIFDCASFTQSGACTSTLTLVCAAPSTVAPNNLQLRIDSASGMLQGYDTATSAWESVCSDYFDANTAAGVCNILGLPSSSPTFSVTGNPTGTGSLPVSDIQCPSTAGSTADCTWNSVAGCPGEGAISLSCGQPQEDFTFQISTHGLLLATRSSDMVTGTVCNDGFTQQTAAGICNIITGDGTKARAWTISSYSSLPVVLDSVVCPSSASNFMTGCQYSLNSDCTNLEAMALSCDGTAPKVTFSLGAANNELMVTAVGSVTATYVGGTGFGSPDTATAVCKMLGYTANISPTVGTMKATTRYTMISSLTCPPTATMLGDCNSFDLGSESAAEASVDIVTLTCGPNAVRDPYSVQLVGTRVQAKPPGASTWGTMCDDGMTQATAQGLCKILGQPSTNVAYWNLRGNGSIVVDSLACPATASSMADCTFDKTSDCSHDEDLALACDTTKPVFNFAIQSTSSNAVMVTVPANSATPGYVCGDNINQATATAICGFAGLPSDIVSYNFIIDPPADQVLLRSITCPASAQSIFACNFSQTGACSSALLLTCQSASTAAAPTTASSTTTTSTSTSTTTTVIPTNPPTTTFTTTQVPTTTTSTTTTAAPLTTAGTTTLLPTTTTSSTTTSTSAPTQPPRTTTTTTTPATIKPTTTTSTTRAPVTTTTNPTTTTTRVPQTTSMPTAPPTTTTSTSTTTAVPPPPATTTTTGQQQQTTLVTSSQPATSTTTTSIATATPGTTTTTASPTTTSTTAAFATTGATSQVAVPTTAATTTSSAPTTSTSTSTTTTTTSSTTTSTSTTTTTPTTTTSTTTTTTSPPPQVFYVATTETNLNILKSNLAQLLNVQSGDLHFDQVISGYYKLTISGPSSQMAASALESTVSQSQLNNIKIQEVTRALQSITLSAMVTNAASTNNLKSGISSLTGLAIAQINVLSIVNGNATITLTGYNINAAAQKLENLTPSEKQSLGVDSNSNFAPNDSHAAPTVSPNTNSPGGNNNDNNNDDGGMKMGPVIGGAIAGVILVGGIGYFLYKKKSASRGGDDEKAHTYFDSTYANFNEMELNDAPVELNAAHRV